MAIDKENFQEQLKRLDQIVDRISKDDLPLEEALKLYEEGSKLVKELEKKIEEAKDKVEKIVEIK